MRTPPRGLGYWLGYPLGDPLGLEDDVPVGWWGASAFADQPGLSSVGYRLRRSAWGRGLVVRTWVGTWDEPVEGWEEGEVDYELSPRRPARGGAPARTR